MKLWTNGTIHTLTGYKAKNILTDNGVIIGIDVKPKGLYETIDLKGGHVYPGFVDAHLHLIGYGQNLSRLSIEGLNKEEILAYIKLHMKDHIFFDGYDQNSKLSKHDLDQLTKTNPIILRHLDFHSITVNSVVLQQVGQSSMDGLLTEADAQKVIKYYLNETNNNLEKYLESAILKLYAYGITGGHSDDLFYFNGYKDTLEVFKKVLSKLKFRTQLLIHHQVLDDYIKDGMPRKITPYLELKGVKVFYDGTLTSKTALLNNGYQDQTSKGIHATKNFIEIVKKVRLLGLTLAIHVIGDLGLDELLDILKTYPPKPDQYDRIIHAPWISNKSMTKLKDIQASLDVQPQFLSSDLPQAFNLMNQRPDYIFPYKTLLRQGNIVSFSSDAPVEEPNPLLAIYDAVNREGNDKLIYDQKEAITLEDAITCYTKYANFQYLDKNRGTIKVGNLADFTVFECDLSTMKKDRFNDQLVLLTIIDEHVVYQKDIK